MYSENFMPIFWASSFEFNMVIRCSAYSEGLEGSANNPKTLCLTIFSVSVTRVATTGFPQAPYSSNFMG